MIQNFLPLPQGLSMQADFLFCLFLENDDDVVVLSVIETEEYLTITFARNQTLGSRIFKMEDI